MGEPSIVLRNSFFMTGDVIILHRAAAGTSVADVLGEVRTELASAFEGENPLNGNEELISRWNNNEYFQVTQTAVAEETYSIVKFSAADDHRSENGYVEPDAFEPENFTTIQTVLAFRQAARESESVQGVLLNWLSGASQGRPIGTGGPGAKPVALTGTPFYKPAFPGIGSLSTSTFVKVFVLDTAPSVGRIHQAQTSFPNHPLLNNLFGTGSHFTIHYNPLQYSTTQSLMEFINDWEVDHHFYDMSDHGTFIAGLIDSALRTRDIQYQIDLLQVLGDKGVGSVESILWGLLQVLAESLANPTDAYVVNCSFTLTTPRLPGSGQALHISETPAPDAAFIRQLEDLDIDLEDLLSLDMLENIFEVITRRRVGFKSLATNIAVVAAAGNQGRSPTTNDRFDAGYPAAFNTVFGVSALDDADQPASYSNRADEPISDGFAIIGGESNGGIFSLSSAQLATNPTPPSINDAIAGLYLAPFPDPTDFDPDSTATVANTVGWAYWSGTSFAAPLVSAAVAIHLAAGQTPSLAAQLLQNGSPGLTIDNEWIIDATLEP